MRLCIGILAILLAAGCTADSPAPAGGAGAAGAAQVHGNLAQVMRGILFPNSNVIFAAQSENPADMKPAADPSTSTNPLTSTYGGWLAVENSGYAIAESANLLTIPGRVCSNGRPVPIKNADWIKFVQELRDAGMVAVKAAQSKNQDNMLDAADAITNACANCHDTYREKPGGEADRCM
jgi:hypothetical protein